PNDHSDPDVKQPVKFDLPTFLRDDVQRILQARATGMQMNRQHDIRAGGDEVEVPVREILSARLPQAYHVGEGHVVDLALTQSPQCDLVITSGDHTPVLFRGAKATSYYPYGSVYAIGEVKATYYQSKNYIEEFSSTIRYFNTHMRGRGPG